jgi:hypothetical protein
MSGLLAGKVWQSNLASHLKPLAAALADIANDDGTSIYPSVAYMAWLLGKGRRSVQTGLSELREAQIIEPVGHDKGGRSQPTEYRLIESNLPKRVPWKELRKGAESAPFPEIKGAVSDTKGRSFEHERAQLSTERVQPTAPDPSVTVIEPSGDTGKASHSLTGLELLRDVARSYPPKESRDRYLEILGAEPNEKLLRECRAEWLDRGYNKISWKWFTEWFANGSVPSRNGKPDKPSNGEKIVADYGDWYLVEACNGDGTSPRYRTAEAFARQTGRDLEKVRAGWN